MEITKTNKKIKDMLDAQMDESGLSLEEVIEPAMISFICQYFIGEIDEDEIVYILNELGYECDLDLLNQEKPKWLAEMSM